MDNWLDEVEATKGWLSRVEAQLLHAAAGAVTTGCIVEVGSYRGRSTIALASGAPDGAPVFAVEPHGYFVGALGGEFGPADRRAFFRTMLRTGLWDRVRLVNLSSEVIAPGWMLPVDLLWVDGDHRYEAVRRDVDVWLPHMTASARLLLDDSTNAHLGPARVVRELLDSGSFTLERQVGKVSQLMRS